VKLRPKLEELEACGLIEKSRRHSVDVWGLTAKDRRRLEAVGDKLTLPESPQHRRWREARLAASQRIAGFRSDVRGVLDEALDLLEMAPEAHSATWFALTNRLHGTCW
jgi:hypothetical protein